MAGTTHADEAVRIGQAEYGYDAAWIHELHLKLPVTVAPVGGDEIFMPTSVEIDGRKAAYVYFVYNDAAVDFLPQTSKSVEYYGKASAVVHLRVCPPRATSPEAGTTLYEDVAYLPFAFSGEDERQFDAVRALHAQLKNPLVVVH